MPGLKVGILHGAMGVFLAQSAIDSGCDVFWASDGRRPGRRERAERAGLTDVATIDRLFARCAVIAPDSRWTETPFGSNGITHVTGMYAVTFGGAARI
jgi:hypothetical protein